VERTLRQRGLTLVELLVAMAVLLVGLQAALLLYDASWQSYKKGENAAEQQQSIRVAFDKLALDLQMAGLNHNPDGDPARPDEQIEAAFDTAIVIRGDFDGQDPTLAVTPEDTLGGIFDIVSTGNDEIVTYVLLEPDTGGGGESLPFEADVAEVPRDGTVEEIVIPNVALIHDDPPYDLFRITFNNNAASYGTGAFFTRTLVAQNVRSLTFRYFDAFGNPLNPTFDLSQTADDIGGAESGASQRARIARIEVDLEVLTRDPDIRWRDPDDANAGTRAYRKFDLQGSITPRNLGKTGLIDLPVL
jgi:prepilin-type N-terminal cleavage/methylation domain-containing protein